MPIRPENRNRYPSDWKAISERIRFTRAEGRCECTGECGLDHKGRCTAEHGKPHPRTASKVALTTAHRHHAEIEDCGDSDLFAACQQCHNRYDAPMRRAGIRERAWADQQALPFTRAPIATRRAMAPADGSTPPAAGDAGGREGV